MSIALTSSINTDKVNTGVASQVGSIRTQEPVVMMCPTWGGVDNFGRSVSSTTFAGTTAGCNLPSDRINVENVQRPQYSSFVTLNAAGIRSNGYGQPVSSQRALQRKMSALHQGQDSIYGSAGVGLAGKIRQGSYGSYSDVVSAPVNTAQRQAQMGRVGYHNNAMYALGGMGWDEHPVMAEGYDASKPQYMLSPREVAEKSCFNRFKEHGNRQEYERCLSGI